MQNTSSETVQTTTDNLAKLCQLARYWIIQSTTQAGSGHLTSSLSAVELMVALMFGGSFRYDIQHPSYPNNDRLIFSKGHASPLFYALWALAGGIRPEELLTLRQFGSRLEGHPTMNFPFTEVPTGSLGQGLSVGVGMALNAQHLDNLPYKTWVLLGDSEMAEGSNWEAMQIASHYKLSSLIGIIDINRLGQRGETMDGYDVDLYAQKCEACGWHTLAVDGHDLHAIGEAYQLIMQGKTPPDKPIMILARTVKGKGIAHLEDAQGWHGKVLTREQADDALDEIGPVDLSLRGHLALPEKRKPAPYIPKKQELKEDYDSALAPRKAYGHALVQMHATYPQMVVLDAEVSNSTFSESFKKAYPERFFEMYIAEQNMIGVACGLSARGKMPWVSTFGAFFTRAYDQLRMSAYAGLPIHCVGSHVGVSIGQDGVSQMGLEDIALFRTLHNAVVVSPADHVSTEKLARACIKHAGITYMRTTRNDVQPLYDEHEEFPLGGSKTLQTSPKDVVTLVATGAPLYEALKAHEILKKEDIYTRVIDAYCIQPIDVQTLQTAGVQTRALVAIEDHYGVGGLADAVRSAVSSRPVRVYSCAVTHMPHSGTAEQLYAHEGLTAEHIADKVRSIMREL